MAEGTLRAVEKAIILDPGQHCPSYRHWIKVEDIIVRGGRWASRCTTPRERVLLGEVSVVNDNRFHQPVGRFSEISEDEPPYRLLVGDHANLAHAI